jgi:hypothetical protein
MFQASKKLIVAAALSAAALLPLASQAQAQQGVSVGALRCDVAGTAAAAIGAEAGEELAVPVDRAVHLVSAHETGGVQAHGQPRIREGRSGVAQGCDTAGDDSEHNAAQGRQRDRFVH